ncbi:hypothetical protein ACU6RU_14155 [Microbacterium sp. F1-18]
MGELKQKAYADAVTASTVTAQHGRTTGMDIHAIVRELNAALGSTLVAALSGSKDRELPSRWAKPDGPEPRDQFANRLQFAHRQWALLAAADGDRVARQWFIGGNPLLKEATPITAIREDRHDAVARAVAVFITGDIDE